MYSTKDDILTIITTQELAQLTDDVNGTVVNDAIVNSTIAAEDRIIDSNVSRYYEVPFSVVPDLIKDFSKKMARVALARRRILVTGGRYSRRIAKIYDECIAQLKLVNAGKADIPGATKKNISSQTQVSSGYVKEQKNVFGGDW